MFDLSQNNDQVNKQIEFAKVTRLAIIGRVLFTIFLAELAVILLILAAVAIGDSRAHAAVQSYQQHEALLIRPQRPIREQEQAVPCLRKAEAPSPVTWELRDKDGNVLMAGSQVVRKRC